MKRRIIAVLLCACLSVVSFAHGEGLLPTLSNAYGIAMPSLTEALHRYPEREEILGGTAVEHWVSITEDDFNAFGVYLKTAGATLQDYRVEGLVFTATIAKGGRTFDFVFDTGADTAVVTYPAGTYDERLFSVKSIWNAAEKAEQAGRYAEAAEKYSSLNSYEGAAEPYHNADQCELRCYYEIGEEKRAAQDWEGAVAEFRKAGGYSDATTQINATRYVEGEAKRAAQDWEGAVTAFEKAGSYSDAEVQISATRYAEGKAKRAAQDWNGAAIAFTRAGDYKDALEQISATRYEQAEILETEGKQDEASTLFVSLGNFRDAKERAYKPYYSEGEKKRAEQDWDGAVLAFVKAGSYSDAEIQISITYYAEGEAKRAAQDWEGAIVAFSKAGDYGDAAMQIKATRYAEGEAKRAAQDWEGAVLAYQEAGQYSDAKTQITETRYQQATALLNRGDADGALVIFNSIKNYKDVGSLLLNNKSLIAAARKVRTKLFRTVGETVKFGHYPQSSTGKDNTEIEWIVLAVDGNKALLISKYGLDAKPFNEKCADVKWERCSLRKWLNKEFLAKAFNSNEQKAILTTTVDNSKSQGYSEWISKGDNKTQDMIFLLSFAEVGKYFGVQYSNSSNNTKSRVEPTEYAIKNGAETSKKYKTSDGVNAGWWWLRSPGRGGSVASYVYPSGSLGYFLVDEDSICVRPALWINLDSDIF